MTEDQATKMNRFRQHIPEFISDSAYVKHRWFFGTQELLALDIVKWHQTTPGFSHFAMKNELLMAILDDGFKWLVVGQVDDPSAIDLPKWAGWKFHAELADGTKTILSTEVISSCGDVLTLRDGSTARNLD